METMMSDQEIADKIKMKVLDEVPFSFGVTFKKSWLGTATVEQYIDQASHDLSARINFSIPGDETFYSLNIPRSWWDHLKIDLFPQWLLNIFPPKYEETYYKAVIELYPLEQFGAQKPEATK